MGGASGVDADDSNCNSSSLGGPLDRHQTKQRSLCGSNNYSVGGSSLGSGHRGHARANWYLGREHHAKRMLGGQAQPLKHPYGYYGITLQVIPQQGDTTLISPLVLLVIVGR